MSVPIQKVMCASCPFRPDRKGLVEVLNERMATVMTKASGTCHQTDGTFGKKTKIKLCRGARDFQLTILHRTGFLEAATDQAWNKKCAEMGIQPDTWK